MNRITSTTAALSLLAAMSTSLAGCEGIHLANLVALGVTLSLFFGTLQLGRRPDPSVDRPADRTAPRPAARLE